MLLVSVFVSLAICLSKFPGSVQADTARTLFTTETAIKRAYFSLMPSSWKVKFAESGHELDADTYLYQSLVRFMGVQELVSKRGPNGKRRAENNGGRGDSRAGRGGNNRRGRGRGCGNYGNYFGRGAMHYGRGNAFHRYPTYGGSYGVTAASPAPAPHTPAGRGPACISIGINSPSPGRSGRGQPAAGRYCFQPRYHPGYAAGRGRGPPPFPQFMTDHYMEDSVMESNDGYDDQYYYDGYDDGEQYMANEMY